MLGAQPGNPIGASAIRSGAPAARPGIPTAVPGIPAARSGGPGTWPGPQVGRTAPPLAPGRRGAGKPGAPARRALPPLPRARAVTLKEFPGIIRQLPQHKPWMVAIGAIAVAVVVAVCSFGSFMLVKDDNAVIGAPPTAETTVVKRDISNREVDPTPMTAADVFPATEIIADPNYPPYKLMGKVHLVSNDCRSAATDEVRKLLQVVGCSQVIRATFSTPDGQYYVTAGVLNLPDTAIATQFSADAESLIKDKLGRLVGCARDCLGDNDAANMIIAQAQLKTFLQVHGHFVIYTVIAKLDKSPIGDDEPGVKVIEYDILQMYLRDHVMLQWSIDKTPPSGSASVSASP
jgi:hypothetical protein